MKNAIELITEERHRQILHKGFSPDHDDSLTDEELIDASLCYIAAAVEFEHNLENVTWPGGNKYIQRNHPRDHIGNLVKAAALLAAEIDRLQRAKNLKS